MGWDSEKRKSIFNNGDGRKENGCKEEQKQQKRSLHFTNTTQLFTYSLGVPTKEKDKITETERKNNALPEKPQC